MILFFYKQIAIGLFSISNELKKNGFTPQIINLGVEKAIDFNFNIAKHIQENNIKNQDLRREKQNEKNKVEGSKSVKSKVLKI